MYWLEKSRDAERVRPTRGAYETYSELAAAYALNGDTQSAAEALAVARGSDEYPTSLAQFRRQWPLYTNPSLRAVADATYFNGLRLAGLPED